MTRRETVESMQNRIYNGTMGTSEIKRYLKKHCPGVSCEEIRSVVQQVYLHGLRLETALDALHHRDAGNLLPA